MQTKIHEPTQIVEVMLTHAEQADEEVKKQLKELYAQYKGTKYTVAVFLSGKRDLYEDTRDLLLFNRRRAAERAQHFGECSARSRRLQEMPVACHREVFR